MWRGSASGEAEEHSHSRTPHAKPSPQKQPGLKEELFSEPRPGCQVSLVQWKERGLLSPTYLGLKSILLLRALLAMFLTSSEISSYYKGMLIPTVRENKVK